MAIHCPYCKSFDLGAGFDTYQCFACGGHLKMDGSPTVPTSGLEVGGTFDGPGSELIEGPDLPHKAQDYEK